MKFFAIFDDDEKDRVELTFENELTDSVRLNFYVAFNFINRI